MIVVDEFGKQVEIDEVKDFVRKVNRYLSEYALHCPNHGYINGKIDKVIVYKDGDMSAIVRCPLCNCYLDTILSYQL